MEMIQPDCLNCCGYADWRCWRVNCDFTWQTANDVSELSILDLSRLREWKWHQEQMISESFDFHCLSHSGRHWCLSFEFWACSSAVWSEKFVASWSILSQLSLSKERDDWRWFSPKNRSKQSNRLMTSSWLETVQLIPQCDPVTHLGVNVWHELW